MIGSSYMMDGQLCPKETFAGNYQEQNPAVYEVIRVIGGAPLFLAEHYERMAKSVESVGHTLRMTEEMLGGEIRRLSEVCGITDQNVRVVIHDFREDGSYRFFLYFVDSHYPTEEMYREGVPTDLLHAVRNNPHAKIVNQSLRDQADRMIGEQGLHEVILTNDAGEITEGSRSNIFFVRGNELFTSPSDGVLLGVTRTRILKVCRENGIPVHEVRIPASEVGSFEAAFISGTSPNILPICRVGEIRMDVEQGCLRRLMGLFDEAVKESLRG